MRNLVLILGIATLFGSTAWASRLGPESSWEEILSDSRALASIPQISFGAFLEPVNQVCIEGNQLRPFNPQRVVCVRWDSKMTRCQETREVYLSRSLYEIGDVCAEWIYTKERHCGRWERREVAIPTHYMVPVYYGPRARESTTPAFYKEIHITPCNQE